jgi:hypothetical protein
MTLTESIKLGDIVELKNTKALSAQYRGAKLKIKKLNYNGTAYHSGVAIGAGHGTLIHPNDVLKVIKTKAKVKATINTKTHTSWTMWGRRILWNKVLTAEQIALIPDLKKVEGYSEHDGKFYPRESAQGLIDFVTAHQEFDLVTQMDSGGFVYGLCTVNRDMYAIALRDKLDRINWLGAKA